MKNLQTLLIILTAALFFTACQKDETPVNFDTISGILTAGEDVSAEDLNTISIYLGKLQNNITPSQVTTTTEEIDFVEEMLLNTDGSFSFDNLPNGNYVLAVSEGFHLSSDSITIASLDGISDISLNKVLNRIEPENSGFSDLVQLISDVYISGSAPGSFDVPIKLETSVLKTATINFIEGDKIRYVMTGRAGRSIWSDNIYKSKWEGSFKFIPKSPKKIKVEFANMEPAIINWPKRFSSNSHTFKYGSTEIKVKFSWYVGCAKITID